MIAWDVVFGSSANRKRLAKPDNNVMFTVDPTGVDLRVGSHHGTEFDK